MYRVVKYNNLFRPSERSFFNLKNLIKLKIRAVLHSFVDKVKILEARFLAENILWMIVSSQSSNEVLHDLNVMKSSLQRLKNY